MNRYLSRKFLIACASLAFAQWSLLEKLISADHWVKVVIAVVGLYAGANVLQKATTKEVAQ